MEEKTKPAARRKVSQRPSQRRGAAPTEPRIRRKRAVVPLEELPVIDYPRENETIISDHYAIRVSAPEGVPFVDVAIDEGPWQACRLAIGHWWYDWTDYPPGKHTIRARVFNAKGLERSAERELSVDLRASA